MVDCLLGLLWDGHGGAWIVVMVMLGEWRQ